VHDKSIHQLRAIAEGYGIPNIFSKQKHELVQAIELCQKAQLPDQKITPPPRREYDTRIMSRRPANSFSKEDALDVLEPYFVYGLKIEFPDPDRWHMTLKGKEDTGTMRMPLRVLLDCADRLLK